MSTDGAELELANLFPNGDVLDLIDWSSIFILDCFSRPLLYFVYIFVFCFCMCFEQCQ